VHLIISIPSQTFIYANKDGENLELSLIGGNARPLSRSVFLMHYLVLYVESLSLQKCGSSSESAIPLAKNILTDSGSDSSYQMVMIQYA
jgi:hypothetical protein